MLEAHCDRIEELKNALVELLEAISLADRDSSITVLEWGEVLMRAERRAREVLSEDK